MDIVREIKFMDCTFIIGRSRKFDKDFFRVKEILEKGVENLTNVDRMELLHIYHVSYHDGGKIEGITSCDSSCHNCTFCQKMLDAAKADPFIICGFCYDEAQESYRVNSLNRHSLNMLIMMTVEFTEEELATLPLTEIVRINSSGDTPNATYARNMIRIAYSHPFCNVGYWAKNTPPVVATCDELGKPDNLLLIQSAIHIGRVPKLAKYFDYVFVVCATKETTAEMIAGGASPCNGMKCRDCGFKCYYGTHNGTVIAEVLRGVSKDVRALLTGVA